MSGWLACFRYCCGLLAPAALVSQLSCPLAAKRNQPTLGPTFFNSLGFASKLTWYWRNRPVEASTPMVSYNAMLMPFYSLYPAPLTHPSTDSSSLNVTLHESLITPCLSRYCLENDEDGEDGAKKDEEGGCARDQIVQKPPKTAPQRYKRKLTRGLRNTSSKDLQLFIYPSAKQAG